MAAASKGSMGVEDKLSMKQSKSHAQAPSGELRIDETDQGGSMSGGLFFSKIKQKVND